MELKDVLYQMMQENMAAGQPTDLRVGTVTSEEPLEITINPAMAPLRRRQLYLTEPVVEKKIPVLTHKHYISTLTHTHTAPGGGLLPGGGLPGIRGLQRHPARPGHCLLGEREGAAH